MGNREIKQGIYAVGAIDWDRRLFDELIPLPDGTSYNAYLVTGEKKVALIDTVDPGKTRELIGHLAELQINRIDYIITHHAEQDHSGSLPEVLELYPEAKVVTNEKCRQMLLDLLPINAEQFITIKDGATLDLGGRTLEFIFLPWVHWPETMVTYLLEEQVLFSCDFFGSHMAQSDLFVSAPSRTYEAAKRYYAEIMMPFRINIVSHLKRLAQKKISCIAPSHGPIYSDPSFILDAYAQWTADKVANKVLIPFVSMHGSTRKMVDCLVECLQQRGIPVMPFNIPRTDVGELAKELVDAATVIIASPMVLAGAHPAMVSACYLINALRPKTRFASIIGSFGWGGKMIEQLQALMPNLKAEFLEPVFIKGIPREADFRSLANLSDLIARKHEQVGIHAPEAPKR